MDYGAYTNAKNPVVTIEVVHFGKMEIQLFPEVAPNTVRNMVHMIKDNVFENSTFHRIISSFMIQGGRSNKEVKAIRGEFKSNGFDNPLKHFRGVISMARTSDPNSATSQFFIMHQDSPHLDGKYAAFGGVVKGFDVLDKIANVKTDKTDAPFDDVVIQSVSIDTKKMTFDPPTTVN